VILLHIQELEQLASLFKDTSPQHERIFNHINGINNNNSKTNGIASSESGKPANSHPQSSTSTKETTTQPSLERTGSFFFQPFSTY
jgi:hypothetical protein